MSSQPSMLTLAGSWKAGPVNSPGVVMSGKLVKKSTPPVKLLMVRPEIGSSRIPPGICAVTSTPSGPSSLSAKRMVKPDKPAKEYPASTPIKKTRSATTVSVSSTPISLPLASTLIMPPINEPSIWPPKTLPEIETPSDSIPIIGLSPAINAPTSIWMPLTVPSNFRPGLPCRPVMVADKVSTNSSGAA